MKRIILFASFIVCFFLNVGAKTPIVQMMEGEVRVGMTTPSEAITTVRRN